MIHVPEEMVRRGMALSRSEARRLIAEGRVWSERVVREQVTELDVAHGLGSMWVEPKPEARPQ